MRKSMATLTPLFSANRAVREYTEKYYLPAAANYLKRAASYGILGKQLVEDLHDLQNKWNGLKIVEVKSEGIENGYSFTASIFLNGIAGDKVVVELFATAVNGLKVERIQMEMQQTQGKEHLFFAKIITTRAASDYTVRIIAQAKNVSIPLENNLILWQH